MVTFMNSIFLKTSTTWVVDYHCDGRPRRWFRAFGADEDVKCPMTRLLHKLLMVAPIAVTAAQEHP
jgi:hypothetical protein